MPATLNLLFAQTSTSIFNLGDFLITFAAIVYEAMPFIVIGAIVSGALEELLPQQFFARFLPKNRMLAITGSSMMGMVLPMCECGIVPVMRRLLKKGVPASCAITYMLSAPVINPIVLWSTSLAFWGYYPDWPIGGGFGMMLLRGFLAFLTAVTVGSMIERLARRNVPILRENIGRVRLVQSQESERLLASDQLVQIKMPFPMVPQAPDIVEDRPPPASLPIIAAEKQPDPQPNQPGQVPQHQPKPRSVWDRLSAIADIAMHDFLDIATFLVLGAALAAAINTMVGKEYIESLAALPFLSVAGMMLLAIVLSLCSEADAFVAANFTGLTAGSKLGFLVLGPMLDIKLFIMYRWVFTNRIVWTIAVTLLVLIYALSVSVDLLLMLSWGSSS